MHGAARALRWFGAALGLLIAILLAVFGLLQTQAGRTWLARTVAQAISDPDFTVAIEGLSGIVPFRLKVERIEIGDRDGVYLTLRDVGLDVSAAALLSRRLHIRSLSVDEIDMARLSTAPSTTPITEYLKVPHLPVEVVLDRLSIGRLALAPPVLGESVVATVEGNAQLAGETAHVALDLHRTDGAAGNIVLALELAGSTPVLSLRLDAAEPTGVLLDRSARTHRPPAARSVRKWFRPAGGLARAGERLGRRARPFRRRCDSRRHHRDRSRAVRYGRVGVAAPAGVRAARRRPACILAARGIRRTDRGRRAVDRRRGGHGDRRWHFRRP